MQMKNHYSVRYLVSLLLICFVLLLLIGFLFSLLFSSFFCLKGQFKLQDKYHL